MSRFRVTHVAGDEFRVDVRGHRLTVDQPRREGEAGPTPTELFVTSLAACVGYYATGYLRRHRLPYEGLRVDGDWTMMAVEHPRVARIRIDVTPPEQVPEQLRAGFQAALEHCTVQNSLRRSPMVAVSVADPLTDRDSSRR